MGARCRVADVGASDELPDAPARRLVGEQLLEQFSQRVGGRVEPAPQGDLSLGVPKGPFAGEVAFEVIGVQQILGRPATDDGAQLPGQVDRVEHPGVDGNAPRREPMGRVAGQQDAAGAVAVDMPCAVGEARQPPSVRAGRWPYPAPVRRCRRTPRATWARRRRRSPIPPHRCRRSDRPACRS